MSGLSQELRDACAQDWQKAHETHPFVVAMGDGTLSLQRFQYFMRQDYLFLIDYARVVAIAAAKSPELGSMEKANTAGKIAKPARRPAPRSPVAVQSAFARSGSRRFR